KAEEISILVRENSEAEKIARALWERKKTDAQPGCVYDVITSDTLKIGQSQVVRFVVNFFRLFARKDSLQVRGEILYGYYRILEPMMGSGVHEPPTDLHELFDPDTALPELFQQWLDADDASDFLAGLLALPLYELAVAVVDHFGLGKITGEKVYLQAFLDMVLEYGRDDCGGIPGFLEWWDASGSNKTLNLPNVKNFIRISSIHQSKGLEYPTVFIPFCNWEVAINSNKIPNIWSVPEQEPFNKMKMLLLKCDSTLKNSVFSPDYYREMLFSIMDNLNLLYVAMTRAINNLYVMMPYSDDMKRMASMADLVQKLVEYPEPADSIDREKYIDFAEFWDSEKKIFEMGTPGYLAVPGEIISADRPNDPLKLNFNNKRMEIRLHSKDYFKLTGSLQTERINKGTVMHQVFEKIITRKDVGPAVAQMVASGLLTSGEGEELFTRIDGLVQEKPWSDWFSEQWKVLNERDILRAGESKHRPDRILLKDNHAVVIDYKTGEKSEKDIRQMKGYLADLRKMGYTVCEGNIWYLQKNEVIKVE
ncbi:MAG TPA: 3'-5' exonuclease, partial [Prolixibacteraceae bacterium]|nr:3'-5' exonuclease [Prolixibacteraceae bacterium]